MSISSTSASHASDMGEDKLRYLLFVCGRWRWRPTRTMRVHGFKLVTFGRELTAADKVRVIALNDEWDRVRRGLQVAAKPIETIYPRGSVGDGYQRVMKLRAAERKAKSMVRTKEQEKRDDWPRAWKWLGPVYCDRDPGSVTPESLLALRTKVAARVSPTEAHRVIKVWRALWKKMAAMAYCERDADPSLVFSNTAPDPRQHVWHHREVVSLVQRAWRMGYKGLAAAMAVAWDTMLSPVDIRGLTAGQRARDARGGVFFLDRAKTGRAAAGTLSRWSEAILTAYLKSLGAELHDSAPIFRTPGSVPGPKGGRRWLPRPYSTSKLDRDFRVVRTALFGHDEQRQFADMRRSGAVEADAGGASGPDLSNKMANTISASNQLRKTYTPVNIASVRRADAARTQGRKAMREAEQKPTKSVITKNPKVS
jgi:hypothetical protein